MEGRSAANTASGEGARGSGYLPTLDGWRAVAILAVLIHHGADSIKHAFGPWSFGFADFFLKYGQMGVHLFFGISGFLICNRLLVERGRSGTISLKAFYIRRAFRILPPLVLFLLVVAALGLLHVIPVAPIQWLAALTFWANYTGGGTWYLGHFWSLAVEEHFYFVWPTVLLLAGPRRAGWYAVAVALLVGAWRAADLLWGIVPASAPNLWGRTDTQLDGLLWGCVAAVLYAQPAWRARLAGLLRGWLHPLIGLFLLAIILFRPRYKLWLGQLVLQAAIIPVVLMGTVLRPRRWLGVVLEWPPVRWIGRLSYGLYIWQQLFLAWDSARAPRMGFLQVMPLNFVAAFGCATLSYYLLEKPLLSVGHRLSARLSERRPAAAGLPGPAVGS